MLRFSNKLDDRFLDDIGEGTCISKGKKLLSGKFNLCKLDFFGFLPEFPPELI